MPFLPAKVSSVRPEKSSPRPITLGRRMLVYVTSVIVACLVAGSLWVSIGAIVEKIKLAHGVAEIIDIVDLTRRMAAAEHDFGTAPHEDLLKHLARLKQIEVTGESDGLKTVLNPWEGALTAMTISDNLFRLETVVPSLACERIIALLTKNIGALELRQIDAKAGSESLRQIYTEHNAHKLGMDDIAAGCRSTQPVMLALTFTLR
jgi:hypothetical protein